MKAISNENIRKDKIITIRCTQKERDLMERKACKESKNLSEYLLDAGIAGAERRSKRDRKRIQQMVEQQENLNGLFLLMEELDEEAIPVPEKLREKIEEIMEGGKELWRY